MIASAGVRLPVQIASHEERRPSREEHNFLVSEEHFVVLRDLAVERLRKAALDGRLKKLQGLETLLYRWASWTSSQEPKNWVIGQVEGAEDALWILRTFLSVMRSEGGGKVQYTRYIILGEIERFIDIGVLDAKTSSLVIESLSTDDRRALRAFRYALTWRAEGKPDDYGRDSMYGKNPLKEDS